MSIVKLGGESGDFLVSFQKSCGRTECGDVLLRELVLLCPEGDIDVGFDVGFDGLDEGEAIIVII